MEEGRFVEAGRTGLEKAEEKKRKKERKKKQRQLLIGLLRTCKPQM